MNVKDVRKKFPQYDALSDKELVDAIHAKYYSEKPIEDYYKAIGYTQTDEPTITPEEEYRPTEEELVEDPNWIQAAKTVYQLNEGPDAIGLNSDQQYANYGLRYMGWFNYNLPKMGLEATQLKEATDEQKTAFVDLMDLYDAKKVSVAGFGRALKGLAFDPSTYVGISTFGAATASAQAFKQAIKEGVKQSTKQGLKTGAKWASIEGAAYSAVDNLGRQTARINAGAQQDYDLGETAKASAFGAAIGAGIGGPLGAYAGRVQAKTHQAVLADKAAKAAERQKKLEERTGVLTRPDVGITLRETPEAPRSEMKFYSAGKLLRNELSSPSDLEIRITKGKKGNFVIKEESGEYVPYRIIKKDKKQGIEAVEKTEQGFAKRFGTPEDAADAIENITQADYLPPSLKPIKEPKVRRAMDLLKGKIANDAPEEIRFLVPQMVQKIKRKDSFGKPYGEARPTEMPTLKYRAKAGEGFREEDGIMEALIEDGYIQNPIWEDALAVLERNDVEPIQRPTYENWMNAENAKKQNIKQLQSGGYNPYRIRSDKDVEKAFTEIQSRVVPDVEPPSVPVGGPSYRLADMPEAPPSRAYADDLERIANEQQQRVDTTEELARRVGAEETSYSRPLAERARESIADTMPDVQADINIGLNKRVVDIGVEILDQLNIPRNPTIQISDQIFNAIEMIPRNPEYAAVFRDVLQKNNIKSPMELANLMKIGVSDAGRRLQQFSQAAKILGPVIDEINGVPKDSTFSTLSRKMGDTIYALDNIRRGLMVSQIATSMRNFTAQVGRVGVHTYVNAMDNILNTTFNPMRRLFGAEEAAVDHMKTFSLLLNLTTDKKKASQVTKLITDFFPNEKDRLFYNYASDVAVNSGDKALQGAQKVVNALNTLNRMQEYFYRNGMFTASLTDALRAKGVDINDVIARNDFSQIKKSDVERAVDDALYFTYAKTPDGKLAKGFVDFVNSVPFVTTGLMPFPRFMANAIQFQYRHSPLGALSLLKPDEIRKIARGDFTRLSQAMVGSAVLMAAVEFKRRGGGGEKWYELKGTDGTTVDMRPYFPLTPYLLVADFIVRAEDGRQTPQARDIVQGLTGAQFRVGAGLAIVDDLMNDLAGIESEEKIARVSERFVSNVLSGFLTPFRMFGDFMQQEQTFRTAIPEERSFEQLPKNIVESLARGVPGLREAYPEIESPTRAAAPGRPSEVRIPFTDVTVPGPLSRQLTGLTVREAKNPAEKELDRLGLLRRDILPYTGDKMLDEEAAKYMGPIVEKAITQLIELDRYKELNNEAKQVAIREALKDIREVVMLKVQSENPERYAALKTKRLPKYVRKLLADEISVFQERVKKSEQAQRK